MSRTNHFCCFLVDFHRIIGTITSDNSMAFGGKIIIKYVYSRICSNVKWPNVTTLPAQLCRLRTSHGTQSHETKERHIRSRYSHMSFGPLAVHCVQYVIWHYMNMPRARSQRTHTTTVPVCVCVVRSCVVRAQSYLLPILYIHIP